MLYNMQAPRTHTHDLVFETPTQFMGSDSLLRLPLLARHAPPMFHHLRDSQPLIDIAIQHRSDQLDALLAHDPRHAQLVVHDLVDAVKGVFLVDEGVEEDSQGPDVLFLAAVGFALQDFGGGVVCFRTVS